MNTTQTIIERSLYEVLRLALLAEGYIADEVTEASEATFETTMKSIVTTKGFAIDLFGVSSNQAKETKRVPRMVLITDRVAEGDLGTDSAPYLVTNPSQSVVTGQMAIAPAETINIQFNIHLVANKASQERVLNSIVFLALGTRKYIPNYLDPTQSFFITQTNYYNLVDTDEGIIEKVYVYEARDLYLEDPTILSTVVAINEITTNINIAKTDLPTNPSTGNNQLEGTIHLNT